MDLELPAGFVTLQVASGRQDELLNIIGVVTHFFEPRKTNGTDYQCTITITDQSLGTPDDGLKVRFFRPTLEALPKIRSVGDVIIISKISLKTYHGLIGALSSRVTEWSVIHKKDIRATLRSGGIELPHVSSPAARRPASAEYHYAIALCNWQRRNTSANSVEPSDGNPPGFTVQRADSVPNWDRKFSLIKDVQHHHFYDLVAQVVKTFPGSGEKYDIYVTDYTSNSLLFNYEWDSGNLGSMGTDGDEFGYAPGPRPKHSWPGPYGRMTLQVTLWSPHSFHAQSNVKEGDNIFLRNVHIKYNTDGHPRLEGLLHTHRFQPERIDISVIKDRDDERVRELLERKRAYWKKAKQQRSELLRTIKDNPNGQVEATESEPEAGKGTEKKRKRRNGKAKGKSKQQKREEKKDIGPNQRQLDDSSDLNKNVRSSHPSVRPTPLSELAKGVGLDIKSPKGVAHLLPFQNLCCRARVRVVDFFPPNLVDFAIPAESSEYDDLSDSGSQGSDSDSTREAGAWQRRSQGESAERWEWRFCLLVEDGQKKAGPARNSDLCRIKVFVAHQDAELLLNMDAQDLRKNPTALEQLKERLFFLWGDLEERKAAFNASVLQENPSNVNQRAIAGLAQDEVTHVAGQALGRPSGKAFECCLKEYGVRLRRQKTTAGTENENDLDSECWERRFRLFGTTIS